MDHHPLLTTPSSRVSFYRYRNEASNPCHQCTSQYFIPYTDFIQILTQTQRDLEPQLCQNDKQLISTAFNSLITDIFTVCTEQNTQLKEDEVFNLKQTIQLLNEKIDYLQKPTGKKEGKKGEFKKAQALIEHLYNENERLVKECEKEGKNTAKIKEKHSREMQKMRKKISGILVGNRPASVNKRKNPPKRGSVFASLINTSVTNENESFQHTLNKILKKNNQLEKGVKKLKDAYVSYDEDSSFSSR